MASSLNKVMIIGNLGRDPEMRYTPSGVPTTSFSVATSRRWNTPEGEQREETEWFNVVTWRKLAEMCSQYLQKGRKVYVEGRLRTRAWDGQDGQKHYRTELIALEVQFLDSRPGAPKGDEESPAEEGDLGADEIPF